MSHRIAFRSSSNGFIQMSLNACPASCINLPECHDHRFTYTETFNPTLQAGDTSVVTRMFAMKRLQPQNLELIVLAFEAALRLGCTHPYDQLKHEILNMLARNREWRVCDDCCRDYDNRNIQFGRIRFTGIHRTQCMMHKEQAIARTELNNLIRSVERMGSETQHCSPAELYNQAASKFH